MVGMLPGWPAPLFFVYLSGAGLVLAGIAIIINRYARIASFLLAGELALIILIMHLPGVIAGGQNVQMSIMFALKDLGLLAGALLIAAHSSDRGFDTK